MTETKERGRITLVGMGSFLCPPGHPEHSASVEYDLRRRKENRGSCSLSYAIECDWLDDAIRAECKRKLQEWSDNRPALDTPAVQEWILTVLGYFKGCYRNPDAAQAEQWNASKVIIDKRDPVANADDHCGVHLIRGYYPDFTPTAEHFTAAYWGTKPV